MFRANLCGGRAGARASGQSSAPIRQSSATHLSPVGRVQVVHSMKYVARDERREASPLDLQKTADEDQPQRVA
eukprot:scaffold124615_cov30-Tisochrysis_lutea.AAC.4